jgi:hypothetical protein
MKIIHYNKFTLVISSSVHSRDFFDSSDRYVFLHIQEKIMIDGNDYD